MELAGLKDTVLSYFLRTQAVTSDKPFRYGNTTNLPDGVEGSDLGDPTTWLESCSTSKRHSDEV